MPFLYPRFGVAVAAVALTMMAGDAAAALPATAAERAAMSAVSAAPVLKNLSLTPRPTITGIPMVDEELTAVPGTWAPTGVIFTYQWYSNGYIMDDETLPTHQLVADDAFSTITVVVTGSKPGYNSVSRVSAPTPSIVLAPRPFARASTPVIVGVPSVGRTFTAAPGVWSPGPVSFAYTWWRDDVAIVGATARTYVVQPGDSGARITVTVTGSAPTYAPQALTSTAKRIG